MPELSRFFGIIIRMFVEIGGPHHRPHFHAYYQDEVAIFGIDPSIWSRRSCLAASGGSSKHGRSFTKRS